jgi:transposase
MNMHVMQSIENILKRNRVALLLFIKKYCCVINSSSNCKKASSEEYGENSGGM